MRDLPSGDIADSNASVEVPYGLRRAFAVGLVVLGIVLIGIVVIQNLPGLAQLRIGGSQPQNNAALGAAPVDANTASHIGLVSGHHGNDSGSVCRDGLTEAQLNRDIAIRVAELLRSQDYTVDILDEYDPKLKGYLAAAFVSIHADSCVYINDLATGFKVARVLDSQIPEEEDRLVACLSSRYKRATGLRFHANTVTYDMTQYHAFHEIDARTPGAIIETGFMNLDRPILTGKPELVAEGIMDGIVCFLKHENETAP